MAEKLPHAVYMQMKYKISDYGRLLEQKDLILSGAASPNLSAVGGRSGKKSDPTAGRALRLIKIDAEINTLLRVKEGFERNFASAFKADFDAFSAFLDYEYFAAACMKKVCKKSWSKYKEQLARRLAAVYGLI